MSLPLEDDEFRDHSERGVVGDVTVEHPTPKGAARARPIHERPVVESHTKHQAVETGNVEGVDLLAVVESEDRFTRRVQYANRLKGEAVQMEGMVGAGFVRDFEFEEVSDPGKAAGRNMGNRLEAVLMGGKLPTTLSIVGRAPRTRNRMVSSADPSFGSGRRAGSSR